LHQLFIDLKKAYYSVLYNILIEFGITTKLSRLIQLCLNESRSRVRVNRHLCDKFPMKNGLKQGDVL